jgi:methylamine dehydrogenase accessory protein MauD
VSIVALWVLVIVETVLLVLLLRALGDLRQKGAFHNAGMELTRIEGISIGEQAPSFEAVDFDGDTVCLGDFQEQRLILAFISPGCRACAAAIQALNAIHQDEHNLSILIVGSSDPELNRVYAAEHRAMVSILTPSTNIERELYRIPGVPFIFVLDETKVIRAKGYVNYREDISQMLTAAFGSASFSV